VWESVNLVHSRLERADNIGIRGLVKSHMAIANLREGKATGFVGYRFTLGTQRVRLENASRNYTDRPGSSPSHAFQKSTAINSVLLMVVPNQAPGFLIERIFS
jgi:hypothetical protein